MGSGGGGGDTKTTTIQDIPREFKPAYLALYNSLFAAARTAAGQQGYPQNFYQPYPVEGYDLAGGIPMQQGADGTWSVPANYGYNLPALDGNQGPITYQQPGGASSQGQGNQGTQSSLPSIFTSPYNQSGAPSWMTGTMGGRVVPESVGPTIVGQAFQGPFNAPVNPLETMGALQRAQLGASLQGIELPVMNLGLNTLSGQYLNPDTNPYLQATIQRAIQPIMQQTQEQLLPQLASEAINKGSYMGSSRRGLLEGMIAREAMNAMGNTAGQIAFENYNQERARQMAAPTTIDEAIRLGQISPELLGQAGSALRGMQQLSIEERLRQYEEAQMAPWRPILPLVAGITGTNVGQMTTTSNPPNSFQSGILGALGGGVGGAAAGYGLSQATGWDTGQSTGWGAGIGAALGGLAGAFS